MKLDEFLKTAGRGSAIKLAKAVGVPASNVSRWRKNKQRPTAEKSVAIEKATLGAVSRKELRPDIFE